MPQYKRFLELELFDSVQSSWQDSERVPSASSPTLLGASNDHSIILIILIIPIANHRNIFNDAGIEVGEYRYWNGATNSLDYDGMLQDLNVQCYLIYTVYNLD